jgi:hypothetical protein
MCVVTKGVTVGMSREEGGRHHLCQLEEIGTFKSEIRIRLRVEEGLVLV